MGGRSTHPNSKAIQWCVFNACFLLLLKGTRAKLRWN